MPFRPVTVTTTSEAHVAYNRERRSLQVFNNGTAEIQLSQNPSNVATDGTPLIPGAVAVLLRSDGDEPELAMYMVADSGSQDVRIVEGLGDPDLIAEERE